MTTIREKLQLRGPAADELLAEIERLRKVLAIEGLGCKVVADIERLQAEIEHLRTTLGYLADNIDNPALVAVAEAALKPKP